jgi:hypothetical protein
MSLWNKNKEPEKKDGEQTKSEKDELLDAFSAVIDAKIKPLSEGFTGLKTEWEAIKAEATKPPEVDPNKNPDGTEVSEEQKRDRQNKALFAQNVLTNARITEQNCIDSIKGEWPQLVDEFRRMCANTPWETKAQPNYEAQCMNAIDALVGREARKQGLRYDKNNSKFIIEDGATRGEGDGDNALIGGEYDWQDPRNPGKTLTGLAQLRKLGLNQKDYDEMVKTGQVQ